MLRKLNTTFFLIFGILFLLLPTLSACGTKPAAEEEKKLVIYSGRSESLVSPLLEKFKAQSGLEVEIRYASTSEMAAIVLEEGTNSPADIFYAQDPGALGALAEAGLFANLSAQTLQRVPSQFASPNQQWVGVSGRLRVLVYNTASLQATDLPTTLEQLTDPKWKGQIGFAPTNSSFQTMITAMRQLWGDEVTRSWLEAFKANEPVAYEGNSAIVEAVGNGEVQLGLVNHYYLYNLLKENPDLQAANHYFNDSGPGSLLMVSGVAMLKTAKHPQAAQQFIEFLLSQESQTYFATETGEYPLIAGVSSLPELPALDTLNAPALPLADLADLQGTVVLLQQAGLLP
ncbi:MAG TPA: iron ABC transporter substrate-binding protein [Anaerolineales bacterium]|nr:iron ABC transporter substrate-binding protein [Anaerolineales bacterium]